MPTRTNLKTALGIFWHFIDNGITREIKPSEMQTDLQLDRNTIRDHLDELVEAGFFTMRTVGITKHYTLAVKLPKGSGAERKPKKTKTQIEYEKAQFQKKVRFTTDPNEPTWEVEGGWQSLEDLAVEVPALDLINRFWNNADYRKECLIGKCPRCGQVKIAWDFNEDFWICHVCFKQETVFRTDSEDI